MRAACLVEKAPGVAAQRRGLESIATKEMQFLTALRFVRNDHSGCRTRPDIRRDTCYGRLGDELQKRGGEFFFGADALGFQEADEALGLVGRFGFR